MVARRIEIITVGDEVLRGETLENNAAFIGAALARAGLEVSRATALPDDLEALELGFREAVARSGVVIATGGLGPTVDDITKEAVIRAFRLGTEHREDIVRDIERRLGERGRKMPDGYRDQGRVPAGASVIENEVGLAVGFRIAVGDSIVFLLPGVPAEMKAMLERSVLPALGAPGEDFAVRLRTFALTESEVEERLKAAIPRDILRGVSIVSTPKGVDLFLPRGGAAARAADVESALGSHVYARGDASLEEIVVRLLVSRGKTVAVAESLTGGLIAAAIVSVPGASETFREGFVTYSDESKSARLGVGAETLRASGAVSLETCIGMAEGARSRAGTDFALATTGIAGPTGATPGKPVGLCFVGLAAEQGTFVRRFRFPGDREMIRLRAAYHALDMLRLALIGAHDRLAPFGVRSA